MGNIKIFLVEDHQILIDSLTILLSLYGNLEIIGSANDGKTAVEMAAKLNPDVIIMDIVMPGEMDGIKATAAIKKTLPDVKIIFLSMLSDFASIRAAFDVGADGFTVKNTSGEEFQKAINCVIEEGMYLHPSLEKTIYSNLRSSPENNHHEKRISLTESEKQVLVLLSEGKTSSQIATEIFRSIETVRSHRKNMLAKFSCSNSACLVRFAMEHRLI